jgi:hypothetical protein
VNSRTYSNSRNKSIQEFNDLRSRGSVSIDHGSGDRKGSKPTSSHNESKDQEMELPNKDKEHD